MRREGEGGMGERGGGGSEGTNFIRGSWDPIRLDPLWIRPKVRMRKRD